MNYANQLKTVEYAQAKLEMKRMSILEKAIKSDSPDDLIAASKAISKMNKASNSPAKAFFIDPLQFNANLGYKDKTFSLSYTTLRRMASTPIINAIIRTRKIKLPILLNRKPIDTVRVSLFVRRLKTELKLKWMIKIRK